MGFVVHNKCVKSWPPALLLLKTEGWVGTHAGSTAGKQCTYPLPRTAPFSEPLEATSTPAGAFTEILATGGICVLRKWGKN